MKRRFVSLVVMSVLLALTACAYDVVVPVGESRTNAVCSLGAVAHVTWRDFSERDRVFAMMRAAGIGYVRSDFHLWRCVPRKAGDKWNFSMYDQVLESAERYGIQILPILANFQEWGKDDFAKHERGWVNFVRETVRHFKGRIPYYEVCNEPNLQMFWNNPNPVNYLAALKAAYRTIKAEDPQAKVVISGFAGVPIDFIGRIYALGGKDFFDVMNVHPYTWPNPPKGALEPMLDGLKNLMTKHGDAAKPVWITEMGWPTHRAMLPAQNLFLAGLNVARPEQKAWRVGYVDSSDNSARGRVYANAMAEILPKGSVAKSYSAAELNEALASDALDAVVYPFDESFPLDTFESVVQFVQKGGVLVDFGGCPMWSPVRNGEVVERNAEGAFLRGIARTRLRLDVVWPNGENGLSASARTFATDTANRAGLKPDPNGFPCFRFFTGALLKPGDEYVPLTTVKDRRGRELAGACVYRFNSDFKGAIVVAGCGNDRGGTGEQEQADYLHQAMDISFARGIEKFFIYEFRAPEKDPYYSEDHFGIVHKDFSPKPAYSMLRSSGDFSQTDRRLSFAVNENGCVTNLHVSGDMTGMNWVHVADGTQYPWIGADKAWGTGSLKRGGETLEWCVPIRRESSGGTQTSVYAPMVGLEVRVERRLERDATALYERYTFVNVSDRPCDLSEIDIHTPFNDNYPTDSSETFMRRCHAHVWPGGEGAWVAAMRMGGSAPHLGLAVVEGSIDAYELKERALKKGLSNVRGVIALSPSDVVLPPGGQVAVAWRIFVHTGWEDFFARLTGMGGTDMRADRYVVRPGESVSVTARTAKGSWTNTWVCPGPGDHVVPMTFGANHSHTSHVEILGVSDPWNLILKRARFIVAHQQVNEPGSPYDGAFVPYDNETAEQQCRWVLGTAAAARALDHAEGGERLGMGVFLALVAQRGYRDEFLPALERYHAFVRNRLQDPDYAVWHTVKRPVRARAFNYPWVIWFHLEMYRLTGENRYLDDMLGTYKRLFNGRENIPDALVAFPIRACIEALKTAGRMDDSKIALDLARAHLTNVAAFDGRLKTMEVGMAPEMVSGCIGQLLDLYLLTGEERYRMASERFMSLAEAVCGHQPSWHAHDIGLHHWDGYWFGKRACWGDTLPHDWNGDMALAFSRYSEVTGQRSYGARAKGIAEAMLGLFTPDGRGTCAWVYPNRVNGKAAHFADPLANDQDWALVFYLLCL